MQVIIMIIMMTRAAGRAVAQRKFVLFSKLAQVMAKKGKSTAALQTEHVARIAA
jgi:hypothetical protein